MNAADAVEAQVANERFQPLKLLVGLAGITDDEGRPDGDVGHGGAQLFYGSIDPLDVGRAAHALQRFAVAVLQGDVEVGQHLRRGRHRFDEFVGDVAGISVHEANPGDVGRGGGDLRSKWERPFLRPRSWP